MRAGLRLLHLALVLFLVSLITFLLVDLFPGDPAIAVLGTNATPERYIEIRDELGLDEPLVQRYLSWMGDTVRGDLGRNIVPPIEDVSAQLSRRFPVTIQIAAVALVMSLVVALPLGMWSAHRAGTAFDRIGTGLTFGVVSVPSFLAALLLIFFFVFNDGVTRTAVALGGAAVAARLAWGVVQGLRRRDGPVTGRAAGMVVVGVVTAALVVWWPSFPRQGFVRFTEDPLENLRYVFLPALTLALVEFAVFTRLLRNDMIATLQQDYVLAARAKGMPVWRVLARDAFRPSAFSLVTLAGISLGRLLGGTVIVETIFRVPGMGTWVVDAVSNRDFPVIQVGVLVLAASYVVVNAAVDLAYGLLDPRVRRGR